MPKGPQGQKRPIRERELLDALGRLHRRINRLADEEARSAWVSGWAARGNLLPLKAKLIQQAEEILDQLMEGQKTAPPKSKKLPRKLPEDPVSRAVQIMREATGQAPAPKKATSIKSRKG
jgi:hypothetical protein